MSEKCGHIGGTGIGAGHVCLCVREQGHPIDGPRPHGCTCMALWADSAIVVREGVGSPTPKEVFDQALRQTEDALSAAVEDISFGYDRNDDPDTGFYVHHLDGTLDIRAAALKIVEALRLRGCL